MIISFFVRLIFTLLAFIFWLPAFGSLFGFCCVTHLYVPFTIRQTLNSSGVLEYFIFYSTGFSLLLLVFCSSGAIDSFLFNRLKPVAINIKLLRKSSFFH